jgi:hypothetical protein
VVAGAVTDDAARTGGSAGDSDPALVDLTFRRPTPADHPRLADVIDEWWEGRRMRQLLPRLWLEHFRGTSWVVDRPDGDLASRGASRVQAVTWPGNRISIAFHRALGFRVDEGPGTQRLYGTPSHPDHDGPGEDRVVFTRDLDDVAAPSARPDPGTDEGRAV